MKIIIEGQHELSGEIKIGGAKNSVVALIPATVLNKGINTIYNVPNISDVHILIEIMENLGSVITFEDETLIIDNTNIKNKTIKEDFTKKLRASYYFMGSMLSKYKYAEIAYPGGCSIGSRPIDYHLNGFEKLGAITELKDNKYKITSNKLEGNDIFLDFASVGATINLMYAAVLAKGKTKIFNAAKEPEIINIASFLASMGAKIEGAGTSEIIINGVENLEGGITEVIPDRIEAGTYIILGSLLGNNLKIKGIIKEHLSSLLTKLRESGANIKINGNNVIVNKSSKLTPINIKTLVYPGFPTDLGQPMSVYLTQCEGKNLFEETIYENRMRHIKHLQSMGANIDLFNKTAIINGKTELTGRKVIATDLRAGASLLVAGMIAVGETEIDNISHILRGYENIIDKLSSVGGKVKLIEK